MRNNSLEYQIEAWLDDQLPDEAAAEIQYLVETDPDALELLEKVKRRRLIVKETRANYYREKLASWEKEKSKINKFGWIIIVVIVGVLSISCFIVGVIQTFDTSPDKPIKMAYKPNEMQSPDPVKTDYSHKPQSGNQPEHKNQQASNVPKSVKKTTTPASVTVLRFLSTTQEGLPQNFAFDTLKSPVSLQPKWKKVTKEVYVSNEVSGNEAYSRLKKARRSKGHKEGSDFDKGIDTLFKNSNEGIRLLLNVKPENGEYDVAQQALAYFYLSQKDYPRAIAHYENFYQKNQRDEIAWMLLGFYLHDYQFHKKEVKQLINLFISDKDSIYGPSAGLLKKQLKL